jgi:predicted Zn finger-like uncharacterized protein
MDFYGFRFVNGALIGFAEFARERVMLIVCPTCATTYQIQLAALGAAGRSVRCTKCKDTWVATPDSVIDEAALVAASTAASPPAPANAPAKPPAPHEQTDEELAAAWGTEAVSGDLMPPDDSAGGGEGALVVANAPPLVPADPTEAGTAKFDPGEPEDIETIAARRARQASIDRKNRRTPLQQLFSLPMLIVVLLVILGAALQTRVAMVRNFPQTASLFAAIGLPVNLRGLIFENVKSAAEFVDGVTVMVVEGTIVNLTGKTLEVPRLRFALRSASGHEVYAWTALPTRTTLSPGGELPFRSRLASPPPDGRDVIVRFFNRRDIGAGTP